MKYAFVILRCHFVTIKNKTDCDLQSVFLNFFEEKISQAKPISHAVRRISQICKANLYHCVLDISLCPTR